MADYHQERQQRLNQRIDEAFPSVGTTQPSHEGSQSSAPDAPTTPPTIGGSKQSPGVIQPNINWKSEDWDKAMEYQGIHK